MSESESTAVVSVEERIKQQLALQQQKTAEMSSKPNLISFKGGQLIVDGSPVPNAEAEVIVLAQQPERTYYKGSYDPAKPQVPTCYSFDLVSPHPNSPEPQSAKCDECEFDKWRSAAQGKGKACRESCRVAVVPAKAQIESAPMYQCSFPVTSMNSVKDFFARCLSNGKLSGEFIAQLKVVPDAKTIFKATLTPVRLVENPDYAVILDRTDLARKQLVEPYPDFSEEAEDKEAAKAKAKNAKY